jgi:hypothetical protein
MPALRRSLCCTAALGRRPAHRWPLPLAACLLAGGVLGVGGSWLVQHGAAANAVPASSSSTAVPAGRPDPAPRSASGTRPSSARTSSARTCLAAVEQADAVISYLIGDVRDRRLEASLYAYVNAARDYRRETAP